jgi:hypothetical protein
LQGSDYLLRGRRQLRSVIKSRLLSGRKLRYLHGPVDLHDKQGTNSYHGVFGVMQ